MDAGFWDAVASFVGWTITVVGLVVIILAFAASFVVGCLARGFSDPDEFGDAGCFDAYGDCAGRSLGRDDAPRRDAAA